MSDFLRSFPSLPSCNGYTQTVYLEPIVNSGERIAIAILAFVSVSEHKVVQALRPELLNCLYGAQAANVQRLIADVIYSLSMWLDSERAPAEWSPPFSGVHIGKPVKSSSHNIDGIIRQAICRTASLSSLAMDADRDDTSDDASVSQLRQSWDTSIKNQIIALAPHLSGGFGHKVQMGKGKVDVPFGFIFGDYVCNFGLMIAGKVPESSRAIKAKVFDLDSLRSSSKAANVGRLEIIIGAPRDDDPTITERAAKKIRDQLAFIIEEAAQKAVLITRVENKIEAAQHIIKQVA